VAGRQGQKLPIVDGKAALVGDGGGLDLRNLAGNRVEAQIPYGTVQVYVHAA